MRVREGDARNCRWKVAVHDNGEVSLVLKLTRSKPFPVRDRSAFSALNFEKLVGLKVLCDGQEVELKLMVELVAELSEVQIKNRQLQVATIRIPVDCKI